MSASYHTLFGAIGNFPYLFKYQSAPFTPSFVAVPAKLLLIFQLCICNKDEVAVGVLLLHLCHIFYRCFFDNSSRFLNQVLPSTFSTLCYISHLHFRSLYIDFFLHIITRWNVQMCAKLSGFESL